MATELKRMTFVVTPEVEELLNSVKKEMFYNRTKSDMIRELVSAGVRAIKAEKATKEKCEVDAWNASKQQSVYPLG